MRVLSFIPAFLLAAASFVAAAPAAADTSCVPSTGTPHGNDAAIKPVIDIFTNATSHLQPYCDQLSAAKANPDSDDVSAIVVKVNAVIQDTVLKLNAVAKIDLSGLDLTDLGAAICALVSLVFTVLDLLVGVVIALAGHITGPLETAITDLLHLVISLVSSLKIYVVADLIVELGPILSLVSDVVDLLLNIVGHLKVLLGVSV